MRTRKLSFSKITILLSSVALLFAIGFFTPSCGPQEEVDLPVDFEPALSAAPLSEQAKAALARTARKSSAHAEAIIRLLGLADLAEASILSTASRFDQMDEDSMDQVLFFRQPQTYPNSCFGNSLLVAEALLNPAVALDYLQDNQRAIQRETEIMASFYGGTYRSQTRAEFKADPFASQVLGGVDPAMTLGGVQHWLGDLTSLTYREVTQSKPEGSFGSTSPFHTKPALNSVIDLVDAIKQSFRQFPRHPLPMYSINHATLIAAGAFGEDNAFSATIYNPINGSTTQVSEVELRLLFTLEQSSLFNTRQLPDLLQNPRFIPTLEQRGFPIAGVLLPEW